MMGLEIISVDFAWYWNIFRDFNIKKQTKYEIISVISLMISYAVGTFFSKYERFDILVLVGSFGLLGVSIVSYNLSIKNNPNKIKVFYFKKREDIICFGLFCSNHSVNDFNVWA